MMGQLIGVYRRAANLRNKEWAISNALAEELFYGNCHYCGVGPETERRSGKRSVKTNGIDRADNSIGYTPTNVVPCCSSCNRIKMATPIGEWNDWVKRFVDYQIALRRGRQ